MSKLVLSYIFKTDLAAFREAILNDNTDKLCRLLDITREYLTKPIDTDGNTALILAIHYASPLTVGLLLGQGADPDQWNSLTQKTPLCIIASTSYDDFQSYDARRTLEKAKILLEYGAYIDRPSLRTYQNEIDLEYTAKETPLMIACRKGNLPLVKFLIEKGANVNYAERHSQIRPIHFTINNGDAVMFDVLVNAGALCCSILTSAENNLLHWFCYRAENDNQIDLLNKILDHGCSIDAKNWRGRTPLMIAVRLNMIETCRVLLKNKASIDLKDSNGNRAIDFAIPGSQCSKLLSEFMNEISMTTSQSNESLVWRKRIDSLKKQNDDGKSSENTEQLVIRPSIQIENTHPNERRDSAQSDTKSHRQRAKHASQKMIQTLMKSRSQSMSRRSVYVA